MKIFIGMKVPRADVELRQAADMLTDTISSAGHQPFLTTDEIAKRSLTDPQEFMPFARQNLLDSEMVILLYHSDLRGGLIEAGMAYAQEIPIWLCHRAGERISSSMLGCTEQVIVYENLEELKELLQAKFTVWDREK